MCVTSMCILLIRVVSKAIILQSFLMTKIDIFCMLIRHKENGNLLTRRYQ